MLGSSTKLANSGPVAAPAVLSNVVIPVLFMRPCTLACTHVAMLGNKAPDRKAAGNIKARHRRAIWCQEARLKAPADVRTASPGKNKYDKSTAIAASSSRTGRN